MSHYTDPTTPALPFSNSRSLLRSLCPCKLAVAARFAVAVLLAAGVAAGVSSPLYAQDGDETGEPAEATSVVPDSGEDGFETRDAETWTVIWWLVAVIGSVAALVVAWSFYRWMMRQEEGDARMVEIAGYVRQGANAYLRQQYKVVAMFFGVLFVVLIILSFGLGAQSRWVPFAFLTGGFFSGLSGWLGMKTATWASSRTAAGAKNSLNAGLQVAFRSGAVMGLVVVGLALLDICLWFAILNWLVPALGFEPLSLEETTVTMLTFGMGASSQALFARVGGGIYTKAADVGADLVGKVEAGIPEDDPRNPATIADNVGDNVGDVAGMGADLYESYAGSILAAAALGVAAMGAIYRHADEAVVRGMQLMAIMLPLALAGAGTALSIIGMFAVRTKEGASQRNLLAALARGINLAAVGVIAASALLVWLIFPDHFGLFGSIVTGLAAGWIIGKWTEYSTSEEYAPTRRIADQAVTGPATVIIAGVAEGFYSTWLPIVVVSAGILAAFGFATGFDFEDPGAFAIGLYGVGIAAVGMLSTLGITLATDAYGPIADNAGGNAQMSEQPPFVRERTDALDSLGNTTAATGKGFAIGSAALTALALLAAYVEEVRIGFERWAQGTSMSEVQSAGSEPRPGDFVRIEERLVAHFGTTARENRALIVFDWEDIPGFRAFEDEANRYAAGEVIPADSETGAALARMATNLEDDRAVMVEDATIPDFIRYYDVTLVNPKVLVGVFLGVMLAFVFCALTMKAVGRAAGNMVAEVRRQFAANPGIMQGTAMPDYAACVQISTRAAQREMVVPSVIGLATPVVVGILLGVGGVMGLLAGALTAGFACAVMMANAGGAWDNAKKYIEAGHHGGKRSEAHKAGVVGDTVGDPFKDTSGPSLNILIKLMSMVSVVFAGLVVRYSLQALGIF